MELEKDNTEGLEEILEVTVPKIEGVTVKEAKEILKETGLELKLNIETEEDISGFIITKQIPQEGIRINSGNSIYCEIK